MTVSIAAALTLSCLLFSGSASAADCSIIGPTGPGSNNQCTDNTRCDITVGNTNSIDVSNDNTQSSSSGGGATAGNTNGGSASSGGASNNGTTSVNIGITNGQPPLCNPAATPGSSTNPPTQPSNTNGRIAGSRTAAATNAQVDAPQGGVSAGSGGQAAPLLATSILAAAVGAGRIRRLQHAR